MPTFSYTGFRDDEPVSGSVEAPSAGDARRILAGRGLRIEHLDDASPIELGPALRRDEAVELGGRIGDVVRSGLPLVSGLQALYAEIPSRWVSRAFDFMVRRRLHINVTSAADFEAVRRALRAMIRRLESGEPVEQVIATEQAGIPPHIPAIIRAGLRTGKLGLFLEQYLGRARQSVDRRRQVALGLAYPLVLLFAGILVLTAVGIWIVPQFKGIFADFGIELPGLTLLVISISDLIAEGGWWLGPGLAVALVAVWIGLRWFGGVHARRRLVYRIPFVGDPMRFAALSEFCHLLAILVEGEEPLPDSLRICGRASHNPDLNRHCQFLAEDIERGTPLQLAARSLSEFPPELVAFFRWDGDRDAFAEALRAAGDIFDVRSRTQVDVVAAVLEPLVIFLVAGIVAGVTVALFLPLIKLLNALS
jgi:type II secretory pathway component PulF